MKNKKIKSLIMSSVLVMTAAAGLAGCKPDHTHSYTSDVYYRVNAEQTKAYTFNKCSCGHRGHEQEMASGTYVIVSADQTAENYVQKVLNTNINNKTVIFAPGEYTELMELTPSRETATIYDAALDGSDLPTGEPSSTVVDLNDVVENKYYFYERNYKNITFAGTEGAVLKNRIMLVDGSARNYNSFGDSKGDRFDPIKDDYDWPVGMTSNVAFHLMQSFDGLTFKNLKFEGALGRIFIHLGFAYSKTSKDVTVENCSFTTDVPHHSTSETKGSSWDAAVHVSVADKYLFNEETGYDESQKVCGLENVIYKNNYVEKHFIGLYAQAMNGATITGNIIKNTEDVGISVQNNDTVLFTGVVNITDNTIDGSGNRAMRVASNKNATITISGNTMKNITEADGTQSFLKINVGSGSKLTCSNNTLDGKKVADVEEGTNSMYDFTRPE